MADTVYTTMTDLIAWEIEPVLPREDWDIDAIAMALYEKGAIYFVPGEGYALTVDDEIGETPGFWEIAAEYDKTREADE